MAYSACYVHIPFCKQRCRYCDFFSFGPAAPVLQQCYADYVLKEMACYQGQGPLHTLYFGGGTPTMLPPSALGRILQGVQQVFGLLPNAEITVEANPATIDLPGLKQLHSQGVNRLSLGVQSFRNEELRAMGRLHTAEDAKKTVALAQQAGFDNISIDLIYGLPGQSLATWEDNLRQAVSLGTQHLSLYSLSVDNDSPWGKLYQQGLLAIPDEDETADMLELAMSVLPAAGFQQYEISNFSLPGRESRHNSAYWQRLDYVGLGLGASSCQGCRRWTNTTDAQEWLTALDRGLCPPVEEEALSPEDVTAEYLFLGLRLLKGINLKELSQKTHKNLAVYYQDVFDTLTMQGLLKKTQQGYCLTRRGLLLGNLVFAAFLPEQRV